MATPDKAQVLSAKLQLTHNTIKAKKMGLLDAVKSKLTSLSSNNQGKK